jgi:hypothetical protein
MSDRITGTTLSFSRKDYDSSLLVFHNSDPYLSRRLAYSPLPDHAIRLLAERHLGRLHSLGDKFSEKSDRSRSPLFSRSIPDAAQVEVVEFLLDNLKLFLLTRRLFLSAFLLRFWSLDLLRFFLGFLRKLFGPLFDLGLERLGPFRLL